MSKKLTIDDILNDDDFGLLDLKPKTSNIKSSDDRLIDSFEEINMFIDKNGREPNTSNMSEYGLSARLKAMRQDNAKKQILKFYDRHNLLGEVEVKKLTIDDILNEEDELGLLNTDNELSIFKYTHIPNPEKRAEADFVAQRKRMKEKDFEPYEAMFQKVHQEIKERKRKIKPFQSIEKNLAPGNFYILDGVLLYLEKADTITKKRGLKSGNRVHIDGRTKTIFENGTCSNMLYRSLGKQIQKNGKLITQTESETESKMFVNADSVNEEDFQKGWVYILKSQSKNPEIASIKDLYKIGFSSVNIDERIKNAKNEVTYLFAEVKKIQNYCCYNINANKLEQLLHRFFATACLNIDLFDEKGQRFTPREWFVVPLDVIDEAIRLILNGTIVSYKYNIENKIIEERSKKND